MQHLAHSRFHLLLLAACAAAPAFAQDDQPPPQSPVYRCGNGVYSQAPCTGGDLLNGPRVSRSFHNGPVPQDRARQMARAQLPPDTQRQCEALETAIRREEARQKASPPTPAQEGDLAIQRVTYREMRC